MSHLSKVFAPLIAILPLVSAPALAQCPMPDGLDGGPCCTIAQANLPVFPVMKQQSLDICWLDCNVEAVIPCRARFKKPSGLVNQPTSCGRYRSRLRLTAGGVKKWGGKVNMTYSRTWLETDSAGIQYQVWRMLIHAQLRPTAAAGAPPCPVPPCANQFGKVRFTGYIDYAQECGTGAWSIAWMLTHSCDFFDHVVGFPRGGVFHERAYSFVGPAAGFAVGPIQPVAIGTTTVGAVRRLNIPPVGGITDTTCEFEEPIQANLIPSVETCFCGAAGPAQYRLSQLFLTGTCGTQLSTTSYVSMGIGM